MLLDGFSIASVESVLSLCVRVNIMGAFQLPKTGLLIFHGKKAKFCGIFRGKFAEKSADFAGKKSKFQENRPISRDCCGKKVKIRRKIGQFRWIFTGGKSKFAEASADFAGF